MHEERTMTEELTQFRNAFVQEVRQCADKLKVLDEAERIAELAELANGLLPFGQELAALFAANCELLDYSNLYGMTGDLEAWGTDPGECVTTDAIRYAITMFLMSEVEGARGNTGGVLELGYS